MGGLSPPPPVLPAKFGEVLGRSPVSPSGLAPGQIYTYPARCWRKRRRLNILEDPRLRPCEFKIGKGWEAARGLAGLVGHWPQLPGSARVLPSAVPRTSNRPSPQLPGQPAAMIPEASEQGKVPVPSRAKQNRLRLRLNEKVAKRPDKSLVSNNGL